MYSPNLCQKCNSTNTQPFDRSYDHFINWLIKENEDVVLHKRFIDLFEVYSDNWENKQRNLYKYFAKSFGCRLVDAGVDVPPDVVDLMARDRFITGLRLTLAVNEDILLMPTKDRDGFIGKGDLMGWAPPQTPKVYNGFYWSEHVSWLTIFYWYNRLPDGRLGSTWVADSQFLYMGSSEPLDDEARSNFIESLRED